jgi:hypothetical protein
MWGGYDLWTRKPIRYSNGHAYIYIYISDELGKNPRPKSYLVILGFVNLPPPLHLAHNFFNNDNCNQTTKNCMDMYV